MMKNYLRSLAVLAALSGPAGAATLAVTPGSGVVLGMAVDGSANLLGAGVICGNNTLLALYSVCQSQAIVNTSGQLLTLSTISGSVGVTGTFFQATQPISAAALPLPTGAASAANQEVTAAGTSATSGQGMQGLTGGVPMPTKSGAYVSAGTGQYGISITSVTTLTVPGGSLFAQLCVETAAARYTDDGTTPSSSVGIPVPTGSCWQISGATLLSGLKIIGAGATLTVSYYK